MSTALEIARAFEAAWQAKDFQKARSYLADDVVMNHPFGRETNAEAVIRQYTGISPVVAGPAKDLAGFGDDTSALIMYELPTSAFGTGVNAMRYVVGDGKIAELTLVYDATAAKTQMQQQQSS